MLAWLFTTSLTWRNSIRHVAIDLSATYRAAVRTGLPNAVVDHAGPEWKVRRRLMRNREGLTDEQLAKGCNPLPAEGKIGRILLTAWIAEESLRNLLASGPHAPTGTESATHDENLTQCVDADIPEVRTLATAVDRWWPENAAFIDSGHSYAKGEGINRVIKLDARAALRFRNTADQRLRTHCDTTCRVCGHLRTVRFR